jgi:hypothetical protein
MKIKHLSGKLTALAVSIIVFSGLSVLNHDIKSVETAHTMPIKQSQFEWVD